MIKVRLKITKEEQIRYISHLDYVRIIERAIRRANLPIIYSKGYNQHMKLSFASALMVGITSIAEYMDIELYLNINIEKIIKSLQAHMPSGISILDGKIIDFKTPTLMAVVNYMSYKVFVDFIFENKILIKEGVDKFNLSTNIIHKKITLNKHKYINIKNFVDDKVKVKFYDNCIEIIMNIIFNLNGSIKPVDILRCLCEQFLVPLNYEDALIQRTGIFIKKDNMILTPFE